MTPQHRALAGLAGWVVALAFCAPAWAQNSEVPGPVGGAPAQLPDITLPNLGEIRIAPPRQVRAATAALGMGRQRLALVVGLATVGTRVVVDSAPRDTQAVATALRNSGFVVMLREDISGAELRASLKEFHDRLQPEGVGFVYAAGLGVQVDGQNLLLPRETRLDTPATAGALAAQLRLAGVPVTEMVDALVGPTDSPRMLVLDAAYRHPALAGLPAAGLAEQRLNTGTMALFSFGLNAAQEVPAVAPLPIPAPTDPLQIAATPFAATLVKALTAPRISGPEALRSTRRALVEASLGQTAPWLGGDTDAREEFAEATLLDGLLPRTPEEIAREAASRGARVLLRQGAGAGAEQSVAEVLQGPGTALRSGTPSGAEAAADDDNTRTRRPQPPSSNAGSLLGTAAGAVGTVAGVAATVAAGAAVAGATQTAAATSAATAAVGAAGTAVNAGTGLLAAAARTLAGSSNESPTTTQAAPVAAPAPTAPAPAATPTAPAPVVPTTPAPSPAAAPAPTAPPAPPPAAPVTAPVPPAPVEAAAAATSGGDAAQALARAAATAAAQQVADAAPAPNGQRPASSSPSAQTPDHRTVRSSEGGERPNYLPRRNPFGYTEGDTFSYRVVDRWKGEVIEQTTTAIEEVLDNGQLYANAQQLQMDPQGRLKMRRNGDGSVSEFEPGQDLWWANPQRGQSKAVRFIETVTRTGRKGRQIEWKGSSSVGRARTIDTPAGPFEALPVETSGWYYETLPNGTVNSGQFSRTVWYSPQLGHPVAIDIEDTDRLGKLLKRERVELTHAQSARMAH